MYLVIINIFIIFSLFVYLLQNSDRSSLFCPFKPRKTIKTI